VASSSTITGEERTSGNRPGRTVLPRQTTAGEAEHPDWLLDWLKHAPAFRGRATEQQGASPPKREAASPLQRVSAQDGRWSGGRDGSEADVLPDRPAPAARRDLPCFPTDGLPSVDVTDARNAQARVMGVVTR